MAFLRKFFSENLVANEEIAGDCLKANVADADALRAWGPFRDAS